MDPLGDSGQFISNVPAVLERQIARSEHAMARLRAAQRRLAERPTTPDHVRKVAEPASNSATAFDSALERVARVIASAPEHPTAQELVLAVMRMVDGIEHCVEVLERADAAAQTASPTQTASPAKAAEGAVSPSRVLTT
ncbi:MAG TPA: hypothetical protein VND93_04540 [Myxococcales bacterium]|nr:hypothetical protein [Myxococcales bacterium]